MDQLTEIYNYLPLTERLLTSGQPTEKQFAAVAAAGVRTVINLAVSTSTNALPGEAHVVTNLGMEYVPIPVEWEHPTLTDLDRFCDAMDMHTGQKVLVHCAANMRVSAFVALYRILRLGWVRERAFNETRRIWEPDQDETWRNFIASALESNK
jgi:protein tyrosine phosphatase (PTP) superfamily phosphohydrolase (DUF442 family)